MKISNGSEARGVRSTSAARKRGATAGAGFAGHLGQPKAAASADAVASTGSVAALLAVQAAGDPLEGRRRAIEHADSLLDRLDSLRLALLEGRLDDDTLRRLAAEVERHAEGLDDPDLSELVAQIELRAQVELAKRGLI